MVVMETGRITSCGPPGSVLPSLDAGNEIRAHSPDQKVNEEKPDDNTEVHIPLCSVSKLIDL